MDYSQTNEKDFFSSGKFMKRSMTIYQRFNFFQLIELSFIPRSLPIVEDVFVDKKV